MKQVAGDFGLYYAVITNRLPALFSLVHRKVASERSGTSERGLASVLLTDKKLSCRLGVM